MRLRELSWRRHSNAKFIMTNDIIIQQKVGIYHTLECPNIIIQIYTSNLLNRISFYILFQQQASLAFNSSCMRKQKIKILIACPFDWKSPCVSWQFMDSMILHFKLKTYGNRKYLRLADPTFYLSMLLRTNVIETLLTLYDIL